MTAAKSSLGKLISSRAMGPVTACVRCDSPHAKCGVCGQLIDGPTHRGMPLFGSKKDKGAKEAAKQPAPTPKQHLPGSAAAGQEAKKKAPEAEAKADTKAQPGTEAQKKAEAAGKAKGGAEAEASRKAEESRQKAQAEVEAGQQKEVAARQKEKAAQREAEKAAAQKEAAARQKEEAAAAQLDTAARKRHDDAEKGWRTELQALTAKQSLESGLAERLTTEIVRLRHKLLEGADAAEVVEREIVENGAEMERARADGSSEIGRLHEQCAAVSSVRQLFGSFETDCLDVIAQAEEAHEEAAQQKSQAQNVAARISEELREAEGRLKKAEERKVALEGQMRDLVAEIAPVEAKLGAELQGVADAALSSRLQAQLGERHAATLKAELAALEESEAEVRRHAAKAARAAETRKQVTELEAQLATDEASMRRLSAKEKALEAQRGEAARRGQKMGGVFSAQLGSARSLAEIQQKFVSEQLKQAAAAAASRYSAHELIDETAGFVKAELAASLKEVSELEAASAAHAVSLKELQATAAQELKKLQAERQAVGVANGERQRFFEEKSRRYFTYYTD